jgi:ankyrin repeat protein
MSVYFEKYKSLSKNHLDIVIGLNEAISESFKEKSIDINFLKFLLISPELEEERKIYKKESIDYLRLSLEEMILLAASEKNYYDLVHFIFTDLNVDKEYLYRSLDYSLYLASSNGSFEVVEYLSSSPELDKLANINYIQSPLMVACEKGHLNIVKFLLESPKLKEPASLKIIQDFYGFSYLCSVFSSNHVGGNSEQVKDYINKRLDVMKYLILEKNLQKTVDIDRYINQPENKVIKTIFNVKDLNSELKYDLNNDSNIKKPKL